MNRKNLTAAVLAGLAGAAGLAGTAQAVNLNPDGLGQVLIYPYFTSNDGNQTVLSVVNTTDQAKAVKVRFLEGYNSREVLDFNLYLSAYDVWVAGIADVDGTPNLFIPDTSCTVPYLYGMGIDAGMEYGMQPFLPYAYEGKNTDGGPTGIGRAAEGHFEMIEMGTLIDEDTCVGVDTVDGFDCPTAATKTLPARPGAATAATHVETADGPMPYDCNVLVENWTGYGGAKPHPYAGVWYDESEFGNLQASSDTLRNSGGLLGGAAVINPANGTMFSYDAKAIQGYDKTSYGVHYRPGNRFPSLRSGSVNTATVFFGVPQNKAVTLSYGSGVDAVSAVFMHDNMMNTYTVEEDLNAASEFVFTFPTKSFYVDTAIVGTYRICEPDPDDALGCEGWQPGDPYPKIRKKIAIGTKMIRCWLTLRPAISPSTRSATYVRRSPIRSMTTVRLAKSRTSTTGIVKRARRPRVPPATIHRSFLRLRLRAPRLRALRLSRCATRSTGWKSAVATSSARPTC